MMNTPIGAGAILTRIVGMIVDGITVIAVIADVVTGIRVTMVGGTVITIDRTRRCRMTPL